MRVSSIFAAAAILATTAPPAAAQDYVSDRVVASVTQDDLVAVVGALGHQVLEQGGGDAVFVVAQADGALNYFLFGTACDANGVSGCQGIMMQMRFDLPAGTTLETLAKANDDAAAIKVWADFEGKTLGITRYHVLDGGVTMANIRENVNVMLALAAVAYPIAAGEE
ncbi:MAG: YbjN domain-containing protein [Erythrobacter sp.]|nr:YbjN domain-containing protein [Erythrobacter sp.]